MERCGRLQVWLGGNRSRRRRIAGPRARERGGRMHRPSEDEENRHDRHEKDIDTRRPGAGGGRVRGGDRHDRRRAGRRERLGRPLAAQPHGRGDPELGAPARRPRVGLDRGHRHRSRRPRVGLRPVRGPGPRGGLRGEPRPRPDLQVPQGHRRDHGQLRGRPLRAAARHPRRRRRQRLGHRLAGQRGGHQGPPGHQVHARGRGADAPRRRRPARQRAPASSTSRAT